MKISGFSLIELLIVMLITAIMFSFGFNSYKNSKVKVEIRRDQQYLLQLPGLVESYFSEQLKYPDNLDDFLTSDNGQFLTPENHYALSYTLDDDDYLFTATKNNNSSNLSLGNCTKLLVYSSGRLQAFDSDNNDISAECWD